MPMKVRVKSESGIENLPERYLLKVDTILIKVNVSDANESEN